MAVSVVSAILVSRRVHAGERQIMGLSAPAEFVLHCVEVRMVHNVGAPAVRLEEEAMTILVVCHVKSGRWKLSPGWGGHRLQSVVVTEGLLTFTNCLI